MRRIGREVVDALVVVRDAGRLLIRHWPALVVLFLAGAAMRNGMMWLALVVSRYEPFLASFIVPLAPMFTLVAIILMLRVLAPSLQHVGQAPGADQSLLGAADKPTSMLGRGRLAAARSRQVAADRLALLAGTLVPFITVYAVQGYLELDRSQFINEAYADEYRNRVNYFADEVSTARTLADESTAWLVVVIVIALVLRWLVDALKLNKRGTGWGLAAAFLEVTWLTWFATLLTSQWRVVRQWAADRAVLHWIADAWEAVTGWLGPLGSGLEATRSQVVTLLGNFDAVIVVPLAWLTIGAVAYARVLPTPAKHQVPQVQRYRTHLRTGVDAAMSRARKLERVRGLGSGWAGLPPWLRSWVLKPVSSLTSRFTSLWRGLSTMAAGGLGPMLVFCVIFLLSRQLTSAIFAGMRLLVGPQDPSLMVSLSPYFDLVARGITTVVQVVLIAAAVDRMMRPRDDEDEEGGGSEEGKHDEQDDAAERSDAADAGGTDTGVDKSGGSEDGQDAELTVAQAWLAALRAPPDHPDGGTESGSSRTSR